MLDWRATRKEIYEELLPILSDGNPGNAPSNLARFWLLVFLLFMPCAIWLLLAAVLRSITLRVENGTIEQRLWRCFVLERESIQALTRVSPGSFSALVLHFRGGTRMALPGIHVEDQSRFVSVLSELRPDLDLP